MTVLKKLCKVAQIASDDESSQSVINNNIQLLTLQQVAEALQVSLSDVRRKIRAGRIPCVRLGARQLRVRAIDVAAYIKACAQSQKEGRE